MKRYFLLMIFLLTAPLFSQEKIEPKPADFAGEIGVTGTAGSLLALEIPYNVYRGLERPDRGDIRVFDSSGIPVPFLIRSFPKKTRTPRPQSVPFFVWMQENENSLPTGNDIEIDTAGAVVRIKNSSAIKNDSSGLPVYLVDFIDIFYPEFVLRVTVDNNNNFFNGQAAIRTSSDLNQWHDFRRQTVSYYGESSANRNELEIPKGARYALISFDRRVPNLISLEAVFPEQEVPAETRENAVSGKKSEDGKTVLYDTGGYYPLTAVDFRFKEPDSIQVKIKNRIDLSDERYQFQWNDHIYLFYSENNPRTNKPFTQFLLSSFQTGRYWELEVLGESAFNSIPECVLIWEPLELVFLARGTGPWTIAFGNADYPPLKESALTLSPEDTPLPATLTGESRYTIRIQKTEKSRPWSQWILWGTLIIAAGLLTVLALIIARSIKSGVQSDGNIKE